MRVSMAVSTGRKDRPSSDVCWEALVISAARVRTCKGG